jgi:hypothetical protein
VFYPYDPDMDFEGNWLPPMLAPGLVSQDADSETGHPRYALRRKATKASFHSHTRRSPQVRTKRPPMATETPEPLSLGRVTSRKWPVIVNCPGCARRVLVQAPRHYTESLPQR